MNDTLMGIYERTLNNCKFYEKQEDRAHLLNEVGCLRGVAYCMELAGECPHNDDFMHFIQAQNIILDELTAEA